jgi:hypothetical protein
VGTVSRRRTDDSTEPPSVARPNPLLDPAGPPAPGYVPITCTEHGQFVAWCSPPAPSSPVACPRSCECVLCGCADGVLVPMIHAVTRGRIDAHPDCGTARGYVPSGDVPPTGSGQPIRPAAPCTGAPDLCGAPVGEPCLPGCPSLAADPAGPDCSGGAR